MRIARNRRSFLTGLSAAAAVGLLQPNDLFATSEPSPETIFVRLPRYVGGAYCWAAPYLARELLRAEGLTAYFFQGDVTLDHSVWMAHGATDFSINYVPLHIQQIDAGVPIKVLTGLHSGCLELIANDRVHSINDLRGKRVGVSAIGSTGYTLMSLIAAYVGLDPEHEIEWVADLGSPTKLFAEGKIDAFLGAPTGPQELREKKIGHTIFNTTTDKPWSQYFCCMISVTDDYLSRFPITSKRVVRAILKAADLCVSKPEWVAQELASQGFLKRKDYAEEVLKEIRYDRWRDFDSEDSLRFYALRMQEINMVKSSPEDIIANGSDWHILDNLKRELKA